MIEEKEKPSDDEIRLTDLAGRILQDALIEQDSGSKINKTLMKLQSIVDQLVSIPLVFSYFFVLYYFNFGRRQLSI